jgi:integrase
MAKVNFYLKDPTRTSKETLVYLFFSFSGKRLKYSTGETIQPKNWNEGSQRVKRSFTGSVEINRYLKRVQEEVLRIHREFKTDGENPSTTKIREALNEAFEKNVTDTSSFFSVYDLFVETTKTSVKHRTTQKYNTLKNHLVAFQKFSKRPIEFDEIDIGFYERLMSYYINELGLLNNTIGKYISTFKTFLNWATERNYNSKVDYIKFKAYKEDADIVYLEEEELMRLFHFDLSKKPRLQNVRDAFCLGCFTGLRFSDIKNLKADDVRNDTIIINTFKTKETLRIPLNALAKSIIDKYKDEPEFLHIISNQKMNDYLKEVCELVKIDHPITLTKYRGVERIEYTKPKYDFVSSHTARRTFVTLSLEKGMRPEIVMKLTGHKSYKTFKKYIKITDRVKDAEMRRVWDKRDGKSPLVKVS